MKKLEKKKKRKVFQAEGRNSANSLSGEFTRNF